MNYPATHVELTEGGYRYNRSAECRGPNCRATVYWYLTPAGLPIPMSRVFGEHGKSYEQGDQPEAPRYEPHFASCVDVEKFRRRK